MKTLLLLIALTLLSVSCQTDYYHFNDETFLTKKEVRNAYDEVAISLPENYFISPTIYHRIERNDSIFNYISFNVRKCDSSNCNHKFEFNFEQDSLFLLLDNKLPKFSLKDLDGIEVNSSVLLGKPSLINFWGTGCSPCVAEIPDLNKLYDRYSGKMNFIAISDDTCPDESLEEFLKLHPFQFHILTFGDRYKDLLKVNSVPKNIFIDSKGFVRYIQGNYPLFSVSESVDIDDKDNYFVKIIERLIAEQ